jgi:16S rRNA C1402 N4-methylase RsmH
MVKREFRQLAGRGFVEIEPSPRGPARDEIRHNPRARSARLRVIQREEAA